MVLKGIEGWLAGGIKRHDLAVHYRLVRESGKSFGNRRIPDVEIVIVPGAQVKLAARLVGDSSIAVVL